MIGSTKTHVNARCEQGHGVPALGSEGSSALLSRRGTICLSPDSILSPYLGADSICIAIFKYCDSTRITIRKLRFLYWTFLTPDHGKKSNHTSRDCISWGIFPKTMHITLHATVDVVYFLYAFNVKTINILLKKRERKINSGIKKIN